MTRAASLTLIALGAILAFAVHGHPPFLNVQVTGWVIMATGAAGMLVPRSGYNAVRRRIVRKRYRPADQVTETDQNVETVERVEDYYIAADPPGGG